MFRKCFLVSLFFQVAVLSFSMVANPFLRQVKQPDGKVIKVKYVGNEFKNFIVDENGNVLKRDSKGFWRKVKDNSSSPFVYGDKVNVEKDKKKKSFFSFPNFLKQKEKTLFLKKVSSPFVDSKVKQNNAHPVLIILIEFSDFSHIGTEEQDWANAFFSNSGKSVKTYYNEISYGKVDIVPVSDTFGKNNGVVGWIRLPYNHPDFEGNITLDSLKIASDAIKAADDYVDFSVYDTNGDNLVSVNELSIFIVVAGYEASYSPQYHPSVWGHKAALYEELGYPGVFCDGVVVGGHSDDLSKTGGYMEIGEWHQSDDDDGHMATIGVMCHELAHDMFGIIDLYDIDYSSHGIGCFGLMGAGSWGMSDDDRFPGETPVHFCAWSKVFCGFSSPETLMEGQYEIASVETVNDIKKVLTPVKDEYFLLENRQQKGFDRGLFGFFGENGGGIAVWHIIENAYNNSQDFRRKVDLVSARRCGDMFSLYDLGKREDLFYEGNNTTLTPFSIPSSNILNGVDSRVSLTDFSSSSDRMSFKLSYNPVSDFDSNFKTISSFGADSFVSIAVDNERKLVFALNLQNGFQIYKISEDKLNFVARADALGLFVKCVYEDGFLYVIDANGRALIYNVEDETHPYLVSEINYLYQSMDLAVKDNYLYIVVGDGFLIVDVSDKVNPEIVYENYDIIASISIALKDNALYITSYSGLFISNPERGVWIYDISDEKNPEFIKRIDTGDETRCAVVYGNYLLAGNGPDYLFDISDPFNPVFIKKLGIHGTYWGVSGDDLFVSTLGDINGTFRCYDLTALPDVSIKWNLFKISRCFGEIDDYLIFSSEGKLILAKKSDLEGHNVLIDEATLGNYSFLNTRIQKDENNFFRFDSDKYYAVQVKDGKFSEVKEIPFFDFYVKNNVFYVFEYSVGHYVLKIFDGVSDLTRFQYKGKADTDFGSSVFSTGCLLHNNFLFVPGVLKKDDNDLYQSGIQIFDVSEKENPQPLGTFIIDKDEFVSRICVLGNYLYIAAIKNDNGLSQSFYLYTVSIQNKNNPEIVEKREIQGNPVYRNIYPIYLNVYKGKIFLVKSDATLDIFNQNTDGVLQLIKEADFSTYIVMEISEFFIQENFAYIIFEDGVLKVDISDLNNFKVVNKLPFPYSTVFYFLDNDYVVSVWPSYGKFILVDGNSWEVEIPYLDEKFSDRIIYNYVVDENYIYYVSDKNLVKVKIEDDSLTETKRVSKYFSQFSNTMLSSHQFSYIGEDTENLYVFSSEGKRFALTVFDKESLNALFETFFPENLEIERANVFGRDVFLVVKEDDGYYLKHFYLDNSNELELKGNIKLNDKEADFFYFIEKKDDLVVVNDYYENIYLVKVENDGNLTNLKVYENQGMGLLRVRGDYLFLCGNGIKMYEFEGDGLRTVDCIFDNFQVDDVYFDGEKLTVLFKNEIREYNFNGSNFVFSVKSYLSSAVSTNFIEKSGDKFVLFDVVNASRIWLVKEYPSLKIKSFTADKLEGKLPLSVNFTVNYEGNTEGITYFWDFDGDGIYDETTSEPEISYTYLKKGIYFPKVKIKGEEDNFAISNPLKIKVYEERPYILPLGFAEYFDLLELNVINPFNFEQTVKIRIIDLNGNVVNSKTKTLLSKESLVLKFNPYQGFLKLTSDNIIVVSAILKGNNRTVSFAFDNYYTDKGFIPHIAEETYFWDNVLFVSSYEKQNFTVSTTCDNFSFEEVAKVVDLNPLIESCGCYSCAYGEVEAKSFNPFGDNDFTSGFECFLKKNSDGAGFKLENGGYTTLYFPHIPVEKDIFWTGLSIVNLSDENNKLTFKFFYPNGMEYEEEYSIVLKPKEKLKGTIKDLFEDLPDNTVSCIISSDFPITGCEIYGTFTKGIAGFSAFSKPVTEGYFSLNVAQDIWNGVAIFNPNNDNVNLTIRLIDENGNIKQEKELFLNPYEHSQFVVKEMFDDIADGDYLSFSSNAGFFAIGVIGDYNYNTMRAIPITR